MSDSTIPEVPQPKNPININQRLAARKTLKVKAFILLPKHAPIAVNVVSISFNDLCVISPFNPPINLICNVKFPIPIKPKGSVVLETNAIIIYSIFSSEENGFKVGLKFNTPPDAEGAIVQFLCL